MMYRAYYKSPIGLIEVTANSEGVTSIYFVNEANDSASNEFADEAIVQLDQYFTHRRKQFDLPLSVVGTSFQESVWNALRTIDYGKTCSYRDIATSLQNPNAVRAVGAANGRNPISIVVPCHRVIAADGSLSGYAGGTDRKAWLLAHERESRGMS